MIHEALVNETFIEMERIFTPQASYSARGPSMRKNMALEGIWTAPL
jgi:hypothetical protein